MRQATSDTYLLLNPDTIVIDDSIGKAFNRFWADNSVACGIQLLYEDRSIQISGSYFMKGGINHLLPIPYWGNILKSFAKLLNTRKPGVESVATEVKVDWISGAFLMLKKNQQRKWG